MDEHRDPSAERQPACRRCGQPLTIYYYEIGDEPQIGCTTCGYLHFGLAAECEIAGLS